MENHETLKKIDASNLRFMAINEKICLLGGLAMIQGPHGDLNIGLVRMEPEKLVIKIKATHKSTNC